MKLLYALILSFFLTGPLYAGTYTCDKPAGEWCVEFDCKARSGESTVGCTQVLTHPYWTFTDPEPYPPFCNDFVNIGMSSATTENWSGTDLGDCDSIIIVNTGTTDLEIFLHSAINPWPLLILPGETISRKVNHEFNVVYIKAPDSTGGNCTIRSFR